MSSYHQEVAVVSKKIDAFFKKTFSSLVIDGPTLDLNALSTQPLMLVSTHRSHVDYFLVGNIFHLMGMRNLRFAAGDNLTNLPFIGKRFKSFGAFAIERDTGFDRNYVRNLCNSVITMIERGDTVLVFPEGGRSYSGAMLEMHIGVLGASVLSQAKTPDRDVNYLPIAVSYENAPDVPWYHMQQTGKTWKKQKNPFLVRIIGNVLYFGADICSFLPFLYARFFRKHYGNVYIDYGNPVAVRSVVDIAANREGGTRDEFSAHRKSMQKLGNTVYDQLTTLYRILPMHVVAAQLKTGGSRSASDLADAFPGIIADLKVKGRNVKRLEAASPSENALDGIRQLLKIKAVTFRRNVCSIKNDLLVNYYAATIG